MLYVLSCVFENEEGTSSKVVVEGKECSMPSLVTVKVYRTSANVLSLCSGRTFELCLFADKLLGKAPPSDDL